MPERAAPVAPVPPAGGVLPPLLAHHAAIVEEVCIELISVIEAEASVLKLDHSLSPDSVRESEGILVLLLVGSCLLRHEVKVKVFVAPLAIMVNIEIQRSVSGLEDALAQPYWLFRFIHILAIVFLLLVLFIFPLSNKITTNNTEIQI